MSHRRHDAIIIGGSFARLSAAMYITRARRSVCIIDTGSPRNRFAAHSHGFFTQDGSEPSTMLATARSQVAAYPTATFIEGEAIRAATEPDSFSIRLATGEALDSTKLVLAFGISDELPAIPGLAERWSRNVGLMKESHIMARRAIRCFFREYPVFTRCLTVRRERYSAMQTV